jgi:tRNA threonylcarbamoyladenosine biosynthesis protein TsaE
MPLRSCAGNWISKVNTSKFISQSEEETRSIACEFAKKLQGNEKVCLIGPFGAGKTTFVRGFVAAFGIDPRKVQSPTFTLVREYGDKKKIYHVDLYRLEKENDIFEAGIHELLGTDELVLVEWADRLQKYLPEERIEVLFEHAPDTQREIVIEVVPA